MALSALFDAHAAAGPSTIHPTMLKLATGLFASGQRSQCRQAINLLQTSYTRLLADWHRRSPSSRHPRELRQAANAYVDALVRLNRVAEADKVQTQAQYGGWGMPTTDREEFTAVKQSGRYASRPLPPSHWHTPPSSQIPLAQLPPGMLGKGWTPLAGVDGGLSMADAAVPTCGFKTCIVAALQGLLGHTVPLVVRVLESIVLLERTGGASIDQLQRAVDAVHAEFPQLLPRLRFVKVMKPGGYKLAAEHTSNPTALVDAKGLGNVAELRAGQYMTLFEFESAHAPSQRDEPKHWVGADCDNRRFVDDEYGRYPYSHSDTSESAASHMRLSKNEFGCTKVLAVYQVMVSQTV